MLFFIINKKPKSLKGEQSMAKHFFLNKFILVSIIICFRAQSTADTEAIFTYIYTVNGFNGETSISGPGSTLAQTEVLRRELKKVFSKFSIKSIIDAPCGDFHWMKNVELKKIQYLGIDVVKELIIKNTELYGKPHIKFDHKNVVTDPLPQADIIMCRDLFIHFPNEKILETITNFKRSNSKYLLTTTFGRTVGVNNDTYMGGLHLINLFLPPFNFPKPLYVINEHSTEDSPFFGLLNDKHMVLWALKDLPG